jgi:hypothetical protein
VIAVVWPPAVQARSKRGAVSPYNPIAMDRTHRVPHPPPEQRLRRLRGGVRRTGSIGQIPQCSWS